MAHKRDRDGNKTNRMHAREDNWTKFEEYARQRESVGEGNFPISSRNPLSPTSGRLHKEDMALYGREPATDHMVLAVCEICQRVVKSQAFARHRDIYHPDTRGDTSSLQRVPVRTMGQSSGVLGGVATNGGVTTESGRRSKVLDLDKQCGVYIESDKKYCKKSISCKIHSLEQRRKVVGRTRPLSELIAEYKKMKKIRKQEKLKNTTGQVQAGAIPPYMSPVYPPASVNHVPVSPTSPFTPQSQGTGGVSGGVSHIPDSPPHPSIVNYFDDIEVGQFETNEAVNRDGEATPTVEVEVSDIDLYPKPAAVCSFGRRVTKGRGSSSLFDRRLDSFRYSLVTLTGREKDFAEVVRTPDASTRRKYSSSLNHRSQHKRKYAQIRKDQNHFLLIDSKYNTSQQSQSEVIQSDRATPTTSNVSMKTSSFYPNPSRRASQQPAAVTIPSSSATKRDEIEDPTTLPHPLYQRRSSVIEDPGVPNPEPQYSMADATLMFNNSSMMKQHQNHIMESATFPSPLSVMENNSEDPFKKHQQHVGNHLDHWPESVSEATPTNLLQAMKIAPSPGVNGVINSPGSHGTASSSAGGGMVQPFSFTSQQTYLLNPSHQQPHLFPRGVVPIGLGVPHTPPSSSYPSPAPGQSSLQMPLLFPGDKPDQSLIQLMSQGKPTTPPNQSQPTPIVCHNTLMDGPEDRGAPLHDTGGLNNIGPSGMDHHQGDRPNQYGFLPSTKQFDSFPNAHHHLTPENYFNEFNNAVAASSTINQSVTAPTQYLLNQFSNQGSPIINMSRHSSVSSPVPPLALHQLTATGGLVQSSINDLSSHAPPPPTNPPPLSTPMIPPSPLSSHTQPNNPLHYISPSGKQSSYLSPSQTTGMVSPSRGPAHRTQQRVS